MTTQSESGSGRKPQGDYERFRAFDPATVHEAAGKVGMVDPAIRPGWMGAKVVGSAFTVECHPGDNLMLHAAVTAARPGDVIVATTGSHTLAGAWGEVLAVAALHRGIAGLVIDGAVRDINAIRQLDFPVFSRGFAIGSCTKTHVGTIDRPINLGGVRVHSGDLVLGDDDGLVIIGSDRLEEVYRKAKERQETEGKILTQLREGRTTLELFGLTEILAREDVSEE
ncbi:MAG: 4-carboxy-4-hydroxy-2-oxoadipate aldolase/oxaloacetate decarboxylase [Trueperaceae bacterium]